MGVLPGEPLHVRTGLETVSAKKTTRKNDSCLEAVTSPTTDLTAREAEIIRILRELGQLRDRFVVIGGYAVSAHGPHRFSVDCDLVTKAVKVRKKFEGHVKLSELLAGKCPVFLRKVRRQLPAELE